MPSKTDLQKERDELTELINTLKTVKFMVLVVTGEDSGSKSKMPPAIGLKSIMGGASVLSLLAIYVHFQFIRTIFASRNVAKTSPNQPLILIMEILAVISTLPILFFGIGLVSILSAEIDFVYLFYGLWCFITPCCTSLIIIIFNVLNCVQVFLSYCFKLKFSSPITWLAVVLGLAFLPPVFYLTERAIEFEAALTTEPKFGNIDTYIRMGLSAICIVGYLIVRLTAKTDNKNDLRCITIAQQALPIACLAFVLSVLPLVAGLVNKHAALVVDAATLTKVMVWYRFFYAFLLGIAMPLSLSMANADTREDFVKKLLLRKSRRVTTVQPVQVVNMKDNSG